MTNRTDRIFHIFIRCLLLVVTTCSSVPLFADGGFNIGGFNITDTFKGDTTANFYFGGTPFAYLTSGKVDPEGNGWLRLTNDNTYQKGYAILKKSFPSGLGVLVDLEFKTWRTNNGTTNAGADGFSVFLFDASASPFNIGGWGGSLGYAPYVRGSENSPGLSGGYFGVGFDEYGNYSNGTEGRNEGIGFTANTIGIRGSESGNYVWLTGITPPDFTLQYEKTTQRPIETSYYRRFLIMISPVLTGNVKSYAISVQAKTSLTGAFQTLLTPFTMPSLPPDSLRLGVAASTGADVNFHEVRNMYITTAGGLRITKNVDKTVAQKGDELTYTLDLFNQTDSTLNGLYLHDDLDLLNPFFNVTSIQFNKDGENPANINELSLSNLSITMASMTHATVTIKGTITNIPANHQLVNTAVFNAGTSGFVDKDLSNDTASVTTTVFDPSFVNIALVKKADSKTFVASGDQIQYTFEVSNTGYGILTNVLLSDPMLTNTIEYKNGDTNKDRALDVDETWTYTADYTVTDLDVTHGYIKNSAIAKAFDLMGNSVTDTSGTTVNDNDSTLLTLIEDPFFIPNVFTPNGDGTNDVFEIVGLEAYSNPRLIVHNRWGNEVYKNDDYNNDWAGEGLNEGTYYYILYLTKASRTKKYSGWVLIKR